MYMVALVKWILQIPRYVSIGDMCIVDRMLIPSVPKFVTQSVPLNTNVTCVSNVLLNWREKEDNPHLKIKWVCSGH